MTNQKLRQQLNEIAQDDSAKMLAMREVELTQAKEQVDALNQQVIEKDQIIHEAKLSIQEKEQQIGSQGMNLASLRTEMSQKDQ